MPTQRSGVIVTTSKDTTFVIKLGEVDRPSHKWLVEFLCFSRTYTSRIDLLIMSVARPCKLITFTEPQGFMLEFVYSNLSEALSKFKLSILE